MAGFARLIITSSIVMGSLLNVVCAASGGGRPGIVIVVDDIAAPRQRTRVMLGLRGRLRSPPKGSHIVSCRFLFLRVFIDGHVRLPSRMLTHSAGWAPHRAHLKTLM